VFGLPAERVDAIRAGTYEDLPERERAAAAFAVQAAEDPHRLTDEHFEALAESGFSPENVVELLGVVGLFNFVNTYGIAMDLQPQDRDAVLPTY
jgi:alkylhydroperoxidase family enzyme